MSAPSITVFLPNCHTYDKMFHGIVDSLHLNIDNLPPDFPFALTAQRSDEGYFLIQYDADATEVVEEMGQWEKPSQEYKALLRSCRACLNIHYRNITLAKQCVILIGNFLGISSSLSVVENGNGCLLRLSDVIEHCLRDATWSWERESFPDIAGVADSEWTE